MAQHCRELVGYHVDAADRRLVIQSWVDEVSDRACMNYRDDGALTCLCWKSGSRNIYFDATLHQWQVEEPGKITPLPVAAIHSDKALQAMRTYWGESLWELWG